MHAAIRKTLTGLSVATLAAVAVPASAQTTVYEFGQLLSGDGAPVQADFATLSATVVGNDVVFTFNAHGLDLFDGSQPFIGALSIDGDKVGYIGDVTGGSSVKMAKGGGPDGGWEFRFDFSGKKKDRLVDNESVSWTWFGGAGHFAGIGAHVQGIDYEGTSSAWYHTVAVPEPGTTAMFLSGLVVLAAAARRRQPKA